MGRLAGAHRVPRLRGLRGLGQDVYYDPTTGNDTFNPVTLMPTSGDVTISPTSSFPSSIPSSLPAGYSPGSPGGISPLDASLLSQGISTTGALVSKALTPTPTVTYNAATGQYVATGGAALPSGLTLGSSLSSLFSGTTGTLLLLGGLALVVVMARKR